MLPVSLVSQEAMVQAFALGYRLVDTAQSYDNEAR